MAISKKELNIHRQGPFTETVRNRISHLGVTANHIAVPTADNSKGARAFWMEMVIPMVQNSADGIVWNFDQDPLASGKGAYLPPNTMRHYPVAPGHNTLMVAADGTSTRLDINWFLAGPRVLG